MTDQNTLHPGTELKTDITSERIFVAGDWPIRFAIMLAAAGLALFAVAIIMFIFAVNQPATPDNKFEPGFNSWFLVINGSAVFGCFAFIRSAFLLRQPRKVILNVQGVRIQKLLSQRLIPWGDIGNLARQTRQQPYSSSTIEVVDILGKNGKRLATLSSAVQDFQQMAAELVARSAAMAGQQTFDPKRSDEHYAARDVRRMRWVAWLFLFFTLGMAAALIAGINEEIHERRLAAEGVKVDAKITRAYMYNVTPHVEFSFQDSTGHTITRDAMMYVGPAWEAVRNAETVPVIYLPSSPEWNHLVNGEDLSAQFGGTGIFLSIGGLLMFGFCTLISFSGYDLRIEGGKTRLLRHGKLLKEW